MVQALRDYQEDALNQVRQAFVDGHRRIVLQMPTGAGKTRLAAEMVNNARGKKRRVIFEVPAISLIDQTVEMFYKEGISEVGVIQASHYMTDWSQPIQVASVQTLMKQDVPEADVVIRDECHKIFKFDMEWMTRDKWRRTPFIGLSATPWTRGLGRVYEKLVVGATFKQMIEKKVLAPFRVFAPSHPDLSGVRTVAGEYQQDELSEAMMASSKLVADIVETWKEKAQGRPTICFAVDCAHAEFLKDRFEMAGVPAAYMDADTSLHERAAIKRDCESGQVKVVCNVDVMGFGMDWPFISCISYCRPTKSEIRFVQNIGRGLRTCPGKQDLLVLDHSDTHLRLGFVTDIEHWELNNGRAAATGTVPRVRLPKECPKCGYLKGYGKRLCDNCGHETAPPPPVQEDVRAQLGQFDGKKKHSKKDDLTREQKLLFLAELKAYAVSRGWNPHWASNHYRERFGVWPTGLDGYPLSIHRVEPAATISVATASWIRRCLIKYAKGKAAEEQRAEGGL